MSDILAVNTVLKRTATADALERILWLSESDDAAFIIEIKSKKGLPYFKRLSNLRQEIASGGVTIADDDPWARVVDEEALTDKEKKIRDAAWEAINEIVSVEAEPAIYFKKGRSVLILGATGKHNLTPTTIYKYLRKFWQRGKVKNALLPDYENSGGPGKPKKTGQIKRGRPRKYAFDPDIGIGVNVDDAVKKIFRVAVSRFYNNQSENPLRIAYEQMLKEYFEEDYYYEGSVRKSILIPQSQKPTFTQFRYWCEKEKEEKDKGETSAMIARKGEHVYQMKGRAITGSSTAEVYGPGSRFQIDATVADVYLVSRYNRRWIIGRPVIYFVVDVFSRMIVGVFIGLEGPSWLGAMMALAYAASPKVAFCQEYEVDISEEDWPCHFLSDTILGDRGEMVSRMVNALIKNLNVRIENAAPRRPDWKAIVERFFRTIQERVKPFLPGYVIRDAAKRVGKDYRLDAKLDIYQFTQIIIRCILHHNNSNYLTNYNRSETLIASDVPPIPIKMWEWGIRNRSGCLKSYPSDIVKLNLLPTASARIMESGINFKGMRYSCDKAIREGWFDRARIRGSEEVEITYDPRSTSYAYLKGPNGRSFEKCYLLDPDERYADKTIYEVDYLLEHEKYMAQKSTGPAEQSKVDLIAQVEHIVEQATKETSEVQDPQASKASRIANIRDNRAAEKSRLRKEQVFELGESSEQAGDGDVVNFSNDGGVATQLNAPSYLDLLQKKRKELKNDSTE